MRRPLTLRAGIDPILAAGRFDDVWIHLQRC